MTKSYGINYNKGKIYKLVCNVTGLIYVGSTTKEYLSQRLTQHRGDYQRFLTGKYANVTSFDVIKNGNYDIVLLESYPCNSKDELFSRERYYIETLACVNKCIPGQTGKEYREKHKDKIIEKGKKYYEINKDKIKEKDKEYYEKNKDKRNKTSREYYENNKEKCREYREKNKDKRNKTSREYYQKNKDKIKEKEKEYYEKHKDKIKEYRKEYYENNKDKIKEECREYHQINKDKINEKKREYYENNKDKINEKKNEKYLCQCGSTCRSDGKSKHFKSKKHCDFISQSNDAIVCMAI
jgi:hypothetical protein